MGNETRKREQERRRRDNPELDRRIRDNYPDYDVSVNNRNYTQSDPDRDGYTGALYRDRYGRWTDQGGWHRAGDWPGEESRWDDRSGNSRKADYPGRFGGPSYGREKNTGFEGYGTQRGPHAGRGPTDYRRSDQRIWEDVNQALTYDPFLDATDISVEVADGEVMLNGRVGSRDDKRRAEDLAASAGGVRDVHNRLKVSD